MKNRTRTALVLAGVVGMAGIAAYLAVARFGSPAAPAIDAQAGEDAEVVRAREAEFERVNAKLAENTAFFRMTLLPALHRAAQGDELATRLAEQFVRGYEPAQLLPDGGTRSRPSLDAALPKKEFVFVAAGDSNHVPEGKDSSVVGPFVLTPSRIYFTEPAKQTTQWVLGTFLASALIMSEGEREFIAQGKTLQEAVDAAEAQAYAYAAAATDRASGRKLASLIDDIVADQNRSTTVDGVGLRLPNAESCGELVAVLPGEPMSQGESDGRRGLLTQAFMHRQMRGGNVVETFRLLSRLGKGGKIHFCCKHVLEPEDSTDKD